MVFFELLKCTRVDPFGKYQINKASIQKTKDMTSKEVTVLNVYQLYTFESVLHSLCMTKSDASDEADP